MCGSAVFLNGTVWYRLGEDGEWTDSVPTATESGTYTVYWYFKGKNYTDVGSAEEPNSATATISELHEHDGIRFTQWSDTDSLPTEAGNYFLLNDVTLPENTTWTIRGAEPMNICLNGKTIDGNYGSIKVESGSTLSIFDEEENEGVLTNFYYLDGIDISGTLNMKGGTITDTERRRFNNLVYGGTVLVGSGGVFNASGVTFDNVNGEYSSDGVVNVQSGGIFRMTDGTIKNSRGYRGVVCVNGGTFEIAGSPVITGNTYDDPDDPLRNVYLKSGSVITVAGELGPDAAIGVRTEQSPFNVGDIILTEGFATYNPDTDVVDIFSMDEVSPRCYLKKNEDGEALYVLHEHAYALTADPDDTGAAIVECVNEECYVDSYGRISIVAEDIPYDGNIHGVWKVMEGNTSSLNNLDLANKYTLKYYDVDGNEVPVAYSMDTYSYGVRGPGQFTAKITAVLRDSWEHPTVTGEDMEVELVKTFGIIKETSIVFASGGAAGEMEDAPADVGYLYELPVCTYEIPENMEFAGWQVGDDAQNLKQAGDTVTVSDDMIITAVWQPLPTAPSIDKHALTLAQGAIGVNFYMNLPEADAYDYTESSMKFTVSGKDGQETSDAYDPDERNADGTLFAFTCYVNMVFQILML